MCKIFLALTLFLLFGSCAAIKCYNGSFSEIANFISITGPEVIECSGFCVTQYQNDGQTTNYTLQCDDSTKFCKAMGCVDDIGTSTKTCCCNIGDLCVHPDATKPIIYDLSSIAFSSATAAYQVEGAAWEEGRGPSIWDIYTHRPNVFKDNATGDDACKSYYYWEEDIKLLKSLNVNEYRFSLSWSRILHDGTLNTINDKGIQYYNNLINGLISVNITPVITMYHWDLPQQLKDKGGWLNEATAKIFGEYAKYVFNLFGNRVKQWIPINEPLSVIGLQYCSDPRVDVYETCAWQYYLAAKNLLLGHLEAYKAYQTVNSTFGGGQLGMALNGAWYFPNDYKNVEDQEASLIAFDFSWGLFGHPLYVGDWSPRVKDRLKDLSLNYENRTESRLSPFTDEQIKGLKGSAQFVGVNYYNAAVVTSRSEDEIRNRWNNNLFDQKDYDSGTKSWGSPEWRQMNATNPWIYYTPFGLRSLLNYLWKEYKVPALITENGCMDNDGEELNDVTRIHYLRGHLMAIAQAVQDGVPVMGHTVWSLMDNFEWFDGYTTKFGIHRVDFNDDKRTRTAKASAGFYATAAKSKLLEGFSTTSRH